MSQKVCLDFAEKVINPDYASGISPTIKDLILKAVEERKCQETRLQQSKSLTANKSEITAIGNIVRNASFI